ncbi:hypothetical protein Tdes44962_MAKER00450 [Teratosphaeria destructans]|uniref:Uncharacterized protein n=1 Tax=Teratosphaeria destructans TaxID=418781 RepID=A0A9W7SPX9_9PEZI|nr:hypothetical protein Tdes44962_MAKER00450 [Teratosphaeria destructans]
MCSDGSKLVEGLGDKRTRACHIMTASTAEADRQDALVLTYRLPKQRCIDPEPESTQRRGFEPMR